jgi:sphinganine-1-phosphate aldolase
MIVSRSVHPAFLKAASYFDVKPIVLEMDKDLNFDLAALKASINSNTILVVGSAPQYPHGMVDPIEEIAKIVLDYNIPLHVDSCIGGFVLPFAEQCKIFFPLKF